MIPTQSCCYQVSLVSESYSAHAVMASKGTHLPNSRARHGSRPCASTSQVPRRAVITSAVDGAVRRFCILLPITGTDFLSFCCLSTPSCPAPAARTCSHTQPAAQRESRLNCLACAARPSSSSSYSSSSSPCFYSRPSCRAWPRTPHLSLSVSLHSSDLQQPCRALPLRRFHLSPPRTFTPKRTTAAFLHTVGSCSTAPNALCTLFASVAVRLRPLCVAHLT
jgi:hypothetical protein